MMVTVPGKVFYSFYTNLISLTSLWLGGIVLQVGKDLYFKVLVQAIKYKISYKDILYNMEYSQHFIITVNGV